MEDQNLARRIDDGPNGEARFELHMPDGPALLTFEGGTIGGAQSDRIISTLERFVKAQETEQPPKMLLLELPEGMHARLTALKPKHWLLRTDGDGHWFHIPAGAAEDFDRMLEIGEEVDNYEEFSRKFDKYRTGGGFSHIKCYPPDDADGA